MSFWVDCCFFFVDSASVAELGVSNISVFFPGCGLERSYERLTEPDSGQDGGERVVLRATVSSTVYVVLLLLFNASKDPSQVLVFFTLCYSSVPTPAPSDTHVMCPPPKSPSFRRLGRIHELDTTTTDFDRF